MREREREGERGGGRWEKSHMSLNTVFRSLLATKLAIPVSYTPTHPHILMYTFLVETCHYALNILTIR